MDIHPAANALPNMQADEFESLKADIKQHGLKCPVEVLDGQILDGRHRWLACEELGIECLVVDADLNGQSPPEYVWSLNGERRHITASQLAAVAVELLPELKREAKERQRVRKGNQAGATVEKIPDLSAGQSRDQAAAIVGANPRYVSDAETIKRESPEVFNAIKSGELTVPQAKEQVRPHVSHNAGEHEWYTPKEYIEAARDVMGVIDLYPATSEEAQKCVLAETFYTKEDDGLTKPWRGNVWLNPPYSQPAVASFVDKLLDSVGTGDAPHAILLVNNATDTRWGQDALSSARVACFPGRRIKFLDTNGNPGAPLQGQMILYYGNDSEGFVSRFSKFGTCVEII